MSLSRVCRLSRRCVDREGKKTTLVVVGKGENTTLLSVEVPSILQLAGPREVLEGAQLQLGTTSGGELRFSLRAVAGASASAQPCDAPPEVPAPLQGAWSRYESPLTLTLTQPRSSAEPEPELELCAYVHEYGYIVL